MMNLTGRQFERLQVIEEVERRGRTRRWRCRCACGNERIVQQGNLVSGHTLSCGCLGQEHATAAKVRHGHAGWKKQSPEYRVWTGIMSRCRNPNEPAYPNYGGRGISICARWHDFRNFLADMGLRPSPHHSIDRIDNDGPYAPDNCRWATRIEQNRNTRASRIITWNGQARHLKAWAEETGIKYKTLHARLQKGWSLDRVFGQ